MVVPPLPSTTMRWCMAEPTWSRLVMMMGSRLWFGGSRKGGANMTVPWGPVWWWLYTMCGNHSRYMTRFMFSVSESEAM